MWVARSAYLRIDNPPRSFHFTLSEAREIDREKGENVFLDTIIAEEKARDKQDSTREHAPLKKADDAVLIDTSNMNLEEVLNVMLKTVKERISIGNTCC